MFSVFLLNQRHLLVFDLFTLELSKNCSDWFNFWLFIPLPPSYISVLLSKVCLAFYPSIAWFFKFQMQQTTQTQTVILKYKGWWPKEKITPDYFSCCLQVGSRAQADDAFWTVSSICSRSLVSCHAQTLFLL